MPTELSLPLILSLVVFILHLTGYTLYAINTLKETIRPNAASWLMWMFGGFIEYATYDAIDSETWFSSSLPVACLVGLGMIFLATAYVEMRSRLREPDARSKFHTPKKIDYALISFDAGAGLVWILFNMPTLANVLAVGSSIVTFVPIWRTTLQTGEEKPGPWIFWCLAYLGMAILVVIEGGSEVLGQLFYPLYYLFLHFVVLLLCYSKIRNFIKNTE